MATPPFAPHRETRQRRLIYESVATTDAHPTAEWVYAAVRRAMPRISLGTVYRNLQRLVEQGLLKSWSRGGATRYDADLAPHDHFLCQACGLLLDLPPARGVSPAEKRLKARGHEVRRRVLEYIGLCRDCRRGAVKSRREGEKRWH